MLCYIIIFILLVIKKVSVYKGIIIQRYNNTHRSYHTGRERVQFIAGLPRLLDNPIIMLFETNCCWLLHLRHNKIKINIAYVCRSYVHRFVLFVLKMSSSFAFYLVKEGSWLLNSLVWAQLVATSTPFSYASVRYDVTVSLATMSGIILRITSDWLANGLFINSAEPMQPRLPPISLMKLFPLLYVECSNILSLKIPHR